ncbi:MAG: hypothetical protein ABI852_13365 [Gemmatimonadaceae bacterium]
MTRSFAALALSIAFVTSGARAQDPPSPPPQVVIGVTRVGPTKMGDISKFQAAVAPMDTGGHCEPPMAHPTGVGQIAYRYKFGTNPTASRSVVVVVDSLNHIQNYSDGRGDLRAPFSKDVTEANPLGPFTSITLNAVQGFGTAENRRSALSSEPIRVKADALLNSPNAGFPMKMIELVLNECRKN